MARAFTTEQYLQRSASLWSGYPLSMCSRVTLQTGGFSYALPALFTSGSLVDYLYLGIDTSGAYAGDRAEGGEVSATATVTPSLDTPYVLSGTFVSASERRVYLNGGNKGTNTSPVGTHGALGVVSIGRLRDATPFDSSNAHSVGEIAIWNAELTDAEHAALGMCVSPLFVRADALVAYWPITGRYDPEIDLVGRFDLTAFGPPVSSAHPRVFRPTSGVYLGGVTVATPPDSVFPMSRRYPYHYRRDVFRSRAI